MAYFEVSGPNILLAAHDVEVYVPGTSRPLSSKEELILDESAYVLYYPFQTVHPCLSFDVLIDNLGKDRSAYPLTCYLVAGTSADNVRDNSLIIMKLENLCRARDGNDDSDESDSDDDADASLAPVLKSVFVSHHGGVNRVKACRVGSSANICACWNDQGKVQIWNLTNALQVLDSENGLNNNTTTLKSQKPLFSYSGHNCEGFALEWSKRVPGRLASGDMRKSIYVWSMVEGGSWMVADKPLLHAAAVEDLQFSPTDDHVLASASCDRSVSLWDIRCSAADALVVRVESAHASDVNVISWNTFDPLLLSGGDDGVLSVWDLRHLSKHSSPVASFSHHKKPITSVHWCPSDSTVFVASGEDDQSTIWDLAVEPDDQDEMCVDDNDEGIAALPPQLLFVHQGQLETKEIKWHPQIPGVLVSTALNGFNIFRTISV